MTKLADDPHMGSCERIPRRVVVEHRAAPLHSGMASRAVQAKTGGGVIGIAGLVVGRHVARLTGNGSTRVVGVSVARRARR